MGAMYLTGWSWGPRMEGIFEEVMYDLMSKK